MSELYPKFNAIETRVVASLSPKRQKDMTTSLRSIVTAIENDGGSAGPVD